MSTETPTNSDSIAQETVTRTFDREDVAAFADLSGDHNPLHLDPVYAEDTRFGEPIVHGALVTSLISAALARFEGTVIYVSQDTQYKAPVYPGEKVTAVATIARQDDNGIYTVLTSVENEDGKTVVDGKARIVIDE